MGITQVSIYYLFVPIRQYLRSHSYIFRLRQQGFRVHGIEKSPSLGGVWYTNRYPGARADSPQPYYQFFDEMLIDGWTWSESFPEQSEILAYFEYVDSQWKISQHYTFSTSVNAASWDSSSHQWHVFLSDGRVLLTRWLVCAVGFASFSSLPNLPGLDRFQGKMCHTAEWPDKPIDWKNARVAVIGTGASATQVIQELASQVQHLTVYQRSPVVGLPKDENTDKTAWTDKKYAKKLVAAFPFSFRSERTMDVPDNERHTLYSRLLKEGNWSFLLSTFEDSLYDLKANSDMYSFWAERMRERIDDPRLKDLLIPLKPTYPIGIKRPCLQSGYYEVFNQDNVELVDVSTMPIVEITENGIQDARAHRAFDYIIWATGFEARTNTLTRINIQGKNSITLKSAWSQGVRSHLGLATHGFPNLFYLYGPQSATVRVNAPAVIQAQVDWLSNTLISLRSLSKTSCEATKEAETAWREKVANPWYQTLYPSAKSWETRGNNETCDEPAWYKNYTPIYKSTALTFTGSRDYQLISMNWKCVRHQH